MDRIVFCSRLTMESFERFYDVPVPKCCIYNVIDLEQIRRAAGDAAPAHAIPVVTAVPSSEEVVSTVRPPALLKSTTMLPAVAA